MNVFLKVCSGKRSALIRPQKIIMVFSAGIFLSSRRNVLTPYGPGHILSFAMGNTK